MSRKEEHQKLIAQVRVLHGGLSRLREKIGNKDIPHPATPEYREWHENCQAFMAIADEALEKFDRLAQEA